MSRADLFVVCKNPECGAEVSPYVTECPYCGTRLQRRAPKLDRGLQRAGRTRRLPAPTLGRLRTGEIPGIRGDRPPYATAAIVLATCVVWVITRAGYIDPGSLVTGGPLGRGNWWHVLTAPFTYFYTAGGSVTGTGIYQFVTLFVIALFGWLLERRHGAAAVLGLFLLASCGGIAVAVTLTSAIPDGANGGALALLCAWAVPDLLTRRRGEEHDGDLLGTSVIALVVLAMPLARPEASPIAGAVGVACGYLGGLALASRRGH